MLEIHVGNWTISEANRNYLVSGWGMNWVCPTLEAARKVAALLAGVEKIATSVGSPTLRPSRKGDEVPLSEWRVIDEQGAYRKIEPRSDL